MHLVCWDLVSSSLSLALSLGVSDFFPPLLPQILPLRPITYSLIEG